MNRNLLRMAKRAFGKPPAYVARRAVQELRAEAERFLGPRRARNFGARRLLEETGASSIDALWRSLAARPYAAAVRPIAPESYEALCPGDARRILDAAERALAHRVDFLGSGEIDLGAEIDWHKDYKAGFRWPPQYWRDIDIMNPGRPSDVKLPWELSRMPWAMPCGQAYLLTGDERWAEGARRLIEHWIDANPYAGSVNWAIAMEPAMRILTWTWMFHAFAGSPAWADETFRARFLCSLWMHADFVDRHIEHADVNGNHCDADAAALVFAGLFFGGSGASGGWLERGWSILVDELPKQVSEDGVDYEGSVPYHRFVTELFFLPALYRQRCGLAVPETYRARVAKMAWFAEAYTGPDGRAPVWGDADDARALPFGGQHINDHRYLLGCIGEAFADAELARCSSGSTAECVWLLGPEAGRALVAHKPSSPRSILFREGGYAVLRNDRDHVFVDCAPVGLAGRGGHGHNDILSFEAVLNGHRLIVDCGSFVYTADYAARDAFRSTSSHNTPKVDGEEINRFMGPQDLWWLHDDARPTIGDFHTGDREDSLSISHSGYRRLASPMVPRRTLTLHHATHTLSVRDDFEGTGEHQFEVPLHLAQDVTAERQGDRIVLKAGGARFIVETLQPADWTLAIEPARLSPAYGRSLPSQRLIWRRTGPPLPLLVRIVPDA